MKSPAVLSVILLLSVAASAHGAAAGPEKRPPTPQEKEFYAATVLPAMTTVRKAMPRAPQGWVVERDPPAALAPPDLVTDDASRLKFVYEISYLRIEGVEDEQKRLDEAYAAAQKKHREAAKTLEADLAKKQSDAEKALQKAVKNKKKGEEKKLRKELEEIANRKRAIPAETEQAIRADTEDLLVRDTGLTVRISVNEASVAMPDARSFSRPKAAYALRREGGRSGATDWKPDTVLLLYGDWEDGGKDTFRGKVDPKPFSPSVRTIAVTIISDRTRMEQFLKQVGMKDILGLIK